MRSAAISTFNQLVEFQAAMRSEGNLSLVLARGGHFHARVMLTRLDRMRLMEVQESLSCIGFIQVPANEVLVCLPGRKGPAPVWAGFDSEGHGVVVLGPGQCAHVRTEGPCTWRVFWLPLDQLLQYHRALTGSQLILPALALFKQAPPWASRQLEELHGAAIRRSRALPEITASGEAIHGLEQQLMHSLVECLSAGSMVSGDAEATRMRDVTTRFEKLLEGHATQHPDPLYIAKICSTLGVSDRVLRRSCNYYLGMTPSSYYRLHRMHWANHALRRCGPDTIRDAALRAGYHHLGRFAAAYRKLFGQSPASIVHHRQRRP